MRVRAFAGSWASLFVVAALAIVAACVGIVRTRVFAASPDVAAWGITFDLTISIPLLYWLLVVRSGKAGALTVAPVFLAGAAIAGMLLPRAQHDFLRDLKFFVVPAAEVLLVGALIQRLRRMRLADGTSDDPYLRIAAAARVVVGEGRVAGVVASEAAMFYYALFGWRKKPAAVEGRAFTVHERSGWGTVLACILVLIVAEAIGMHLLLSLWSRAAAWVWTALDLWAVIWLLGDYQALRLRRSSVGGEALHLRYGLRWSVDVPLEAIVAVEPVRAESEWKRKDVLKVAILDEPRWLISLAEPVVVNGLAGIRKTVRGIALLPDDDEAISALRNACGPSHGTPAARP